MGQMNTRRWMDHGSMDDDDDDDDLMESSGECWISKKGFNWVRLCWGREGKGRGNKQGNREKRVTSSEKN